MQRFERHSEEPEILDRPAVSQQETIRALRDLVRVNRFLLSRMPVQRTLVPRLRSASQPGRAQLLLDVGTGFGDIPDSIAGTAEGEELEVRVVGVDRKLRHLVLGARRRSSSGRATGSADRPSGMMGRGAGPWGHIGNVVALAEALPFRTGSVDWCLSTLLFHHFSGRENRTILREMRRVARQCAVVVDLRRSVVVLWLVRWLLPLLGAGRIARHDGLLSVKRSYTLDEVADLVVGEPVEELRRRFPARFSLVLRGREVGPGNVQFPGARLRPMKGSGLDEVERGSLDYPCSLDWHRLGVVSPGSGEG